MNFHSNNTMIDPYFMIKTSSPDLNLTFPEIILKDTCYMSYVKYSFIAYSVMFTFGLPGNILYILSLENIFIKSSQKFFFMCSPISSRYLVFFLVTQFTWIGYFYFKKTHSSNFSAITCKPGDFCFAFFTDFDAFMIILITLERLLAVYKPYAVKILITSVKIKWTIFFIILFF